MYTDHIEFVKPLGKDSFTCSSCKPYNENIAHNISSYTLDIGFSNFKIDHLKSPNKLKLSGSIPYFYQGHNLYSDINNFKTAIKIISNKVSLDLEDAPVNSFEFGSVFLSPYKFEMIDHTHFESLGIKQYGWIGNTLYYKTEDVGFKMYNAKSNFNTKWIPRSNSPLKIALYSPLILGCHF